ncbi:unnamed protein product [Closterium sp. NIES-53]
MRYFLPEPTPHLYPPSVPASVQSPSPCLPPRLLSHPQDYYRVLFAPSHLLTQPSATRIAAGDIAHTRLATDIGTRRQFANMRSVIAALWRAEGIRGLYGGFPASVPGIIVRRSLFFGRFDSAKQLQVMAGLATSSTLAAVPLPFDSAQGLSGPGEGAICAPGSC